MHTDIVNFIQTYEKTFLMEANTEVNSLFTPCKETLDEAVLKSGNYVKMYEYKL